MNEAFWQALDRLVLESEIIIDRPKGTAHPRYPQMIYPLDYGYLKNSASMDGEGIDVWLGTQKEKTVDAIVCTVDLAKRDSEIKILIDCTAGEQQTVLDVHNQSEYMKAILIQREEDAHEP